MNLFPYIWTEFVGMTYAKVVPRGQEDCAGIESHVLTILHVGPFQFRRAKRVPTFGISGATDHMRGLVAAWKRGGPLPPLNEFVGSVKPKPQPKPADVVHLRLAVDNDTPEPKEE